MENRSVATTVPPLAAMNYMHRIMQAAVCALWVLTMAPCAYAAAGFFNSGGTVTVGNSTLSGNRSEFGGGIYNDSNGTVTVDSSTLSNNEANFFDYTGPGVGGDGGAIYNSAGTVTVSNSTLSGNVGDLGGGGIYNDSNGTASVKNSSTVTGNGEEDVLNSGVLYLDSTSTIGILERATPPFRFSVEMHAVAQSVYRSYA